MESVKDKILRLKKEKDALILAHYYQTMDIQEIADIVGDSFELARRARDASQKTIVLCGVRFMAESAKILNPEKTVLLPAPDAGCPMADMVTPEDVLRLRSEHPDAAVVCYVNSSADVKAVSDICCTSSSAVRIVKGLPQREVIFIPDQNLGAYVASKVPEKEIILFEGYCPIHHNVGAKDVLAAKERHPGVKVLAHPECRAEVLALADFIGSTSEILKYAEESSDKAFIIGTEKEICERITAMLPGKRAYALTNRFVCPNMKKTRLGDVLISLGKGVYEINMTDEEIKSAYKSLDRMVKA